MVTALGVDVDTNGNGLDALTHRQIIRQNWSNTGVAGGLTVSGRSDLKYSVSAGMAVCSMGAADGYTEAFWPGGVTEHAVGAGDATYTRIDTVYILANTGNPDNNVHVDVKQGTPAASPVAPELPSGAQPLAYRQMPANGSTTNSAIPYGNINYAIQAGASIGRLGEWWDKTETFTGSSEKQKVSHDFPIRFTLPTDRMVEFVFDACLSTTSENYIEWATGFEVDPASTSSNYDYCLQGSVSNFVSSSPYPGASWETHSSRFITNLTAGTHTAYVASWLQNPEGVAPVFHYGGRAGHGTFIGRRFQIFDRGVAQ